MPRINLTLAIAMLVLLYASAAVCAVSIWSSSLIAATTGMPEYGIRKALMVVAFAISISGAAIVHAILAVRSLLLSR